MIMTIFPKLFHIKNTDYLFQLTSLYMLGRNVNGMGIGKQSILFLEEMIPTGSVYV